MQGYWTSNARKPSAGEVPSHVIQDYLVDTCWVWRKDGPRIKKLKETAE